jgi:hypothetical protein
MESIGKLISIKLSIFILCERTSHLLKVEHFGTHNNLADNFHILQTNTGKLSCKIKLQKLIALMFNNPILYKHKGSSRGVIHNYYIGS